MGCCCDVIEEIPNKNKKNSIKEEIRNEEKRIPYVEEENAKENKKISKIEEIPNENKKISNINEEILKENKNISNLEDISEINIIYNINKDNIFKDSINIFGPKFVLYNYNKCKMIIDDKEYGITTRYNVKNYNNNILRIKLKGINNITNMNHMFYGCKLLSSLPDISKWNTNKVTNISGMFRGCSSLSYIPLIFQNGI